MELFAAIEAGDAEKVRALVQADPTLASARNAEGLTAVRAAQYRRQAATVQTLLDARPELDVFDAAAVGDVDRLKALIAEDRSCVDAFAPDGFFPLGLAAYFDQPDAVRLLLQHGAAVGAVARNAMQVQALHAAVAGRSTESVRLLLEARADPNARQHGGWTPLMAARQHQDQTVIDLLLAHGADAADQLLGESSGNAASTS